MGAVLIPDASQQFFDGYGDPLAGGAVYFYIPGTFTLKTTWADSAEAVPNTNPVILDAAGRALIWGEGSYRQILKDSLGNQIWDRETLADPTTPIVSNLTQLTYTPTGAGAVARTAASKAAEWLSSADFGVVGDGTTNDTAALTLAVAASVAQGLPLLLTGTTGRTIRTTTNLTIAADLIFIDGGKLSPNTATTLTITGSIAAAGAQIFTGAGTITLSGKKTPLFLPVWWGAVGDGVTDDTLAIQLAINCAQTAGGGVVLLAAGTYKIGTTLSITASKVVLQGASQYGTLLSCSNGASNGIAIGFQASSIQGVSVRNLSILGVTKTGGYAIAASRVSNCVFSDLSIRNAYGGISVAILNNLVIQNSEIILGYAAAGVAGILWTSPATSVDRSDVLTIRDTVINGQNFAGLRGISIDGMCQTLRVQSSGILHVDYGLLIQNSAASNTYFPQFIYCDDMEIDGVGFNAMLVQGGRQMHFTNCDFFNAGGSGADLDGIVLLADGSASVTNYITFVSCRIDGARQRAVYCEAKQVEFTSCFINASAQGSNLYDGVVLGNNGGTNGAAVGVNVMGGRIGSVFGGLNYTKWGVTVAAGCSRVLISGVDFSACVTGSIQDNTGAFGNVDWNGCDEINGVPMADRLPMMAADPSTMNDGIMWYNTTSSQVKVRISGVTKVFTVV